jgi:flavorubredoxin
MDTPHKITPDITVLPAHFPILGKFIPINAFVIKAKEPVLVDTGMGMDAEKFMEALGSVIDPADIKWVWLTHDDADHDGNLQKVLEAAPNARLATNCLAAVRMSATWPLSMQRVYWLNPGDSLRAGDRTLTAVRPPLFDNPTTVGIYDDKSEAFFSADFFGALIPSSAQNVDDVLEGDLEQGMMNWASADSPWLHLLEPSALSRALDVIRQMAPKMILSAHLPPARGRNEQFLEWLMRVPASTPFVTPNQAVLEQILAQAEAVS